MTDELTIRTVVLAAVRAGRDPPRCKNWDPARVAVAWVAQVPAGYMCMHA